MTTTKKKPKITFDLRSGPPPVGLGDLRRMLLTYPDEGQQRLQEALAGDRATWERVCSRWTLKELFNALADVQVKAHVEVMGEVRTIMTSAFPLFAGNLSVAGINMAYEAVPTVGQELVREMESNKKWVQVGGILSHAPGNKEVEEAAEFPLIGASQERFDIGNKRQGLRAQITQEMIEENDVEGVIERMNALGEIPAEEIEEQTLKRVTDHDGSAASATEPYVLRINKTGTQLYNATANTPGTRAPNGTRRTNNPLNSTTALENARARLAGQLNSRGKRIAIPMSQCQLLVPDNLLGVAGKLINSEMEPGVENEMNNWGPRGRHRPKLVTTAKLDDLSTTAWYLGAFDKQFRRKWKIRMETVTAMGDLVTFLRSRIAFEARVAWDVEVGADDYVYVIQNLSGTTAPKDD